MCSTNLLTYLLSGDIFIKFRLVLPEILAKLYFMMFLHQGLVVVGFPEFNQFFNVHLR